jgi:putative oxidoreductase
MNSVASQSSRQACGITVLRVVVGIVFLAHGWQKLFGFGFHGVAGFFAGAGIPLPFVSAVIVTLVEFLGGLALVLGLLTRWAAALNAFDMLVAILVVHMKNGFFDQNHGVEYPLTLLAACVALTMLGPGSLSVDGALSKRE